MHKNIFCLAKTLGHKQMGRLVFRFFLWKHHGVLCVLKLRISTDGKKRQGEGLDATVQEGPRRGILKKVPYKDRIRLYRLDDPSCL